MERTFDERTRTRWEDSANTWEYKTALRLVLTTFCELLSTPGKRITKELIAKRAGMESPTYLSSITKDQRLLEGKFADLEFGLKAILSECKEEGIPSDSGRLNAASALLEPSLDARVLAFRNLVMFPAAPPPQQTRQAHEHRKALTALIQAQPSVASFPVPDDDRVLEVVRRQLPHVTRKELAFAYHLLADALIAAGTGEQGDNARVAEIYKRASELHVHDLVEGFLQVIRLQLRSINRDRPDQTELKRLEAEVLEVIQICDYLPSRYRVSSHALADLLKSVAEFVCGLDRDNEALANREYQRAFNYYLRAIDEYGAGRTEGETEFDLAHFYHNCGYCLWRLKRCDEVPEWFTKAIRLYLSLDSLALVAYNLKWQSIAFEAINEPELAVWCAKASVRIYQQRKDEASPEDFEAAVAQEQKILKNAENRFYRRSGPSATDPRRVAQEFLDLWASWQKDSVSMAKDQAPREKERI